MEGKKEPGEKLGEFLAGKGFYIVLLLCAGLIATSIWLMADGSRTDVEPAGQETNVGASSVSGGAPAKDGDDVPVMKVTAPVVPAEKAESPASAAALPEPEAPAVRQEAPSVQAAEEMPEVDYFIWPVNGALLRGCSVETLSYDPTMGDWRVHNGWDIAAPRGEPVLSTANGRVTAVSADDALGAVVEVSHSNGLVSVYANLDPECPVSVGQIVRVGSVLGTVGKSARAESGQESHLHFALRRNGEIADPADWLPQP